MKTGFYSVFYTVVTHGAIALCFLPFLILVWKDIRKVSAWWVLGIYWFLNGLDNLLEVLVSSGSGRPFIRLLSFYFGLTEAPLLLIVFALARHGKHRKGLLLLTAVFIAAESILIRDSRGHLLLVLGSGLGLVILSSLTGLWEYLKKMEHTRFENSMVFVYAALLFYYGSMLIIYIFAHFHRSAGAGDSDSFLLYYVSLLISAVVTCAGLWSYKSRGSRAHAWSASSGYSSSSS